MKSTEDDWTCHNDTETRALMRCCCRVTWLWQCSEWCLELPRGQPADPAWHILRSSDEWCSRSQEQPPPSVSDDFLHQLHNLHSNSSTLCLDKDIAHFFYCNKVTLYVWLFMPRGNTVQTAKQHRNDHLCWVPCYSCLWMTWQRLTTAVQDASGWESDCLMVKETAVNIKPISICVKNTRKKTWNQTTPTA